MSYNGSWDPDFPPVMHFVDHENACAKPWKLLENHPCYSAAKNNEDRAAALTLVQDFLKSPKNQKLLEILKQKYSGSVVVPVRAIEAGGKNRIPEMLAEYISQNTGIDINTNIVQTNKVHRTGSDEWHRFAFRPSYDGLVISNRNYILVDDVFSLGGSFNELRLFIESNHGNVVHTAAIATGRSGQEIALNPKTLKDLVDRYSEIKLQSFLKEIDLYDGNYKALTEPEARALRRAPSLDDARDRILAARRQGGPYLGSGSLQETQYQTSTINSSDHGRGLRR